MIRFENVSLVYGDKTVLAAVDLHVPPGARAALMGPSGCGKTSLLRMAAGLAKPTSGRVTVNAQRLAYAFQEPRLMPWRTAAENVNAVLSDRAATLPEARKWLAAVGLAEAENKFPEELSGGMRQRVDLARAMAYSGDLLFLDEPTKELDPDRRQEVLALLREHAKARTLLMATHSMLEAQALADQVYVFKDGRFIPA